MSTITQETVEALDDSFSVEDASTHQERSEFPETLHGSPFIEGSVSGPGKCPDPGCDAFCRTEIEEDALRVKCLQNASHNTTLDRSEYTRYRISFQTVLDALANCIGTDITNYSEALPRYVQGDTADGVHLCLIVSPNDYESTVESICREAVEDSRPTLLITPTENTERIHEIQSLFAAGHLVTASPIRMFTEPGIIRESVSAMLSREFFRASTAEQQVASDTHEVVDRLVSNPSYTIAELNQMRMLRVSKQIPKGSGTRLEKVSEAALSHLFATYPDAGGEDDSGSKLPDILFRIPSIPKAEQHDEILGIADSKSGKTGNFGSEKVDEKHPRYLQRARRDGPASDMHAHVFVVLGFDGQKEIDFYDKMATHYREDEYMVIVTAEALATMLVARFTYPVHNKIQLQRNDFRSILYPLFHRDWFNDDEHLAERTRSVGANQDEYDVEYYSREGLLILTREIVLHQLTNVLQFDGDIESDLESYFEPMNYQPP